MFVREIPLTQGKVTFVDDLDFDWLTQFTWCYSAQGKRSRGGYAKTAIWNKETKKGKKFKLHNFLLPPKPGFQVDHINRNKLDNRRENLRYVTKRENTLNAGAQRNSKSGLRGVTFRPHPPAWVARAKVHGYYHHIGVFTTPEDASKAYIEFLERARIHPESIPFRIKKPRPIR